VTTLAVREHDRRAAARHFVVDGVAGTLDHGHVDLLDANLRDLSCLARVADKDPAPRHSPSRGHSGYLRRSALDYLRIVCVTSSVSRVPAP